MDNNLMAQIGCAIHHCGALEFLVNNAIRTLAKDELLANEVITYSFSKRITLLRKLLKERSSLKPDEITSLCKDLSDISNTRNLIAHNPIVSDSPNLVGPYILLVRNAPDKVGKLYAKDVGALVNKSAFVMQRITKLLPECTNC
jgi:hypothetical protein